MPAGRETVKRLRVNSERDVPRRGEWRVRRVRRTRVNAQVNEGRKVEAKGGLKDASWAILPRFIGVRSTSRAHHLKRGLLPTADYSKRDLSKPDWRMMDAKVPGLRSLCMGTGTERVVSPVRNCMIL